MFRTVTLPALRPAIVSAASVVFLFCATAFGVVLTLGGMRYSSVETEIYLLTTDLLDLPAAAALSIVQLVAVVVLLGVAARLRAVRDPTVARARRAARPRRPAAATCRRRADRRCCWSLVAAPVADPGGRVAAASTGRWGLDNYRALGSHRCGRPASALLVPVTDALLNSLRTAVDATWMSLLLGVLVAVVVTRRSPRRGRAAGPRACSTGSSCCRSGVSAVTLGFGFLITLDRPPLDLRDSPLLVPVAQALVALPLVVRTLVPVLAGIDDRQRQAAASLGAGPLRAVLTVDLPVVWTPAAGRGRLRVRGLARRVRGDLVPGPRRAPDPAGGDLPAARPSGRAQLRDGPGRLGRCSPPPPRSWCWPSSGCGSPSLGAW